MRDVTVRLGVCSPPRFDNSKCYVHLACVAVLTYHCDGLNSPGDACMDPGSR
eukprot:SAG11_NODE_36047_length_263_cov_1.432927_1_plen_51_part_10